MRGRNSPRLHKTTGRLRLSGPCYGAVRAPSGSGGGVAVGSLGRRRRDLEVLHVNRSLLARVTARTAGLGSFLVGRDVEGDEEEQVGADDADAGEGREFLTSALAPVGSPGEV